MRFHYSLEHANKVLALVQKGVRGVKSANGDHVYVEAWANCREQGYCVKVNSPNWDADVAVCFAQTRSGDSMVVIAGPVREFNNQTNQPSETIWEKNHRYFNDDAEAARYIAQEILRVVEPVAARMMA